MPRIIFIPQYPTPNRYQEWWSWKLPEEFIKAGFAVITIGEKYIKNISLINSTPDMFSPINAAIEFETKQIEEYINLDIKHDDILFLADLSFPGLFCNVLYHKRPSKMFAFCHATSINKFDYFEDVARSKFPVETSHASMFDKVFVGSKYHANKLCWGNTEVTSLPNPDHLKQFKSEVKTIDIVSASRPGKQKVDSLLEEKVEKRFGKIIRKTTNNFEEYYKFLGQAKVLLISAKEDTFGYQIIDAINNKCIPIARNSLSYPELLQRDYLYNNENELFKKLELALWGILSVPKLKCKKQINNFYKTIIKRMNKKGK